VEECPYKCHQDIEKRLRAVEEKKALIEDMHSKIDTLFEYRDGMIKSWQNTEKAILELSGMQHSWSRQHSEQIKYLGDRIETACKGFTDIKGQVDAFGWFTEPMNRWQKKLPWVLVGFIMLVLLSIVFPVDLLAKVMGLWKKLETFVFLGVFEGGGKK